MKILDFAKVRVAPIPEIKTQAEQEAVEKAYQALSVMRKQKAEARKSDKARKESIFAGFLLEEMLKEKGVETPIVYAYSKRGKPEVSGADFSLSHCKKWCACIVSDLRVGVDVEMLGRYRQSVVERFFTEQEQTFLESEKEDADFYFTVLWTCKEALAKCLDLPLPEVCKQFDMHFFLENVKKDTGAQPVELGALCYREKTVAFAMQQCTQAVASYCIEIEKEK